MNRNEALEELAATARSAVFHVGRLNSPEREADAIRWIREKLAELTVSDMTKDHNIK
jgi:hypothetical protein